MNHIYICIYIYVCVHSIYIYVYVHNIIQPKPASRALHAAVEAVAAGHRNTSTTGRLQKDMRRPLLTQRQDLQVPQIGSVVRIYIYILYYIYYIHMYTIYIYIHIHTYHIYIYTYLYIHAICKWGYSM